MMQPASLHTFSHYSREVAKGNSLQEGLVECRHHAHVLS
jgi:hypothetical protein